MTECTHFTRNAIVHAMLAARLYVRPARLRRAHARNAGTLVSREGAPPLTWRQHCF